MCSISIHACCLISNIPQLRRFRKKATAMIDKIQVSTKDYRFSEKANPLIIPSGYYAQQPDDVAESIFSIGGKSFYGRKAIWNTDIINLTINPMIGMEIRFNPAVVIHGNNFYQVNESEFHQSLDIVSKSVKEAGFYLDFESANITRLDIAQDRQMQEPIPVYHQLFRLLRAKRANPKEYRTGYYFGNGYRQAVFYGKLEEMENAGKPIPAGVSNVMRCEYKLLKKPSVQSAGFTDIASIRRASFSEIGRMHRQDVADFAFTDIPEPSGFAYSHIQETEILRRFRQEFKRNALARYTEARCNVLQRFGNIEAYQASLLQAGYHRSYVFRHIRHILKSLSIIEQVESETGGVPSIGRLYAEIYEKFIKEAA